MTPLEQLSELLGVKITDVRRTWVYVEAREFSSSPTPGAWSCRTPCMAWTAPSGSETAADGHGWSRAARSAAKPPPTPCPAHAADPSGAAPFCTPSAGPCTKAW